MRLAPKPTNPVGRSLQERLLEAMFMMERSRGVDAGWRDVGDCQVLQLFCTEWTEADISISSAPHRLGTVFTVADPGRLHLVCWSVFATENFGGSELGGACIPNVEPAWGELTDFEMPGNELQTLTGRLGKVRESFGVITVLDFIHAIRSMRAVCSKQMPGCFFQSNLPCSCHVRLVPPVHSGRGDFNPRLHAAVRQDGPVPA